MRRIYIHNNISRMEISRENKLVDYLVSLVSWLLGFKVLSIAQSLQDEPHEA